jgi:retron-type reverse transcriptase
MTRGYATLIQKFLRLDSIIARTVLCRVLQHNPLDQQTLKAGVLEDGAVTTSEKGTGQGSVISPLLANIYLHYVLDLWAARWRQREAAGDMIIVRYADDFIVGARERCPTLPGRDARAVR